VFDSAGNSTQFPRPQVSRFLFAICFAASTSSQISSKRKAGSLICPDARENQVEDRRQLCDDLHGTDLDSSSLLCPHLGEVALSKVLEDFFDLVVLGHGRSVKFEPRGVGLHSSALSIWVPRTHFWVQGLGCTRLDMWVGSYGMQCASKNMVGKFLV
jgi:hypothetical protein